MSIKYNQVPQKYVPRVVYVFYTHRPRYREKEGSNDCQLSLLSAGTREPYLMPFI
jgi:hypothetical protein